MPLKERVIKLTQAVPETKPTQVSPGNMKPLITILFSCILAFACLNCGANTTPSNPAPKEVSSRIIVIDKREVGNSFVYILEDTKTGKEYMVGYGNISICPMQ